MIQGKSSLEKRLGFVRNFNLQKLTQNDSSSKLKLKINSQIKK